MKPALHLSDIPATNKVRDAFLPSSDARSVGPSRWRAKPFSPILGCFAIVFLSLQAGNALGSPQYFAGTGNYYEMISLPSPISWSEAKVASENRTYFGSHGYLVTITSVAENTFVTSDLMGANINTIAAGGYQPQGSPEPAGNWQWVTGEPWVYSNWRSGEPNNSQGVENILEVNSAASMWKGKWNDQRDGVNNGYYNYVVEYRVVPSTVIPGTTVNPGATFNESGKLNRWNGSGWVQVTAQNENEIVNSKPTVVIVHGWRDEMNDVLYTDMATKLANIQDCNILAWDWKAEANPSKIPLGDNLAAGLVASAGEVAMFGLKYAEKAIDNGHNQGNLLGAELLKLQIDPNKLQLISHSAGAAVIGSAAALMATTGEKPQRLTLLDAPHLSLAEEAVPIAAGLIAAGYVADAVLLPLVLKNLGTSANALRYVNDVDAQQVEVYYSDGVEGRSRLGFGGPLTDQGTANVFNGKLCPPLLQPYMHGYSKEWYTGIPVNDGTPEGKDRMGINSSILNTTPPSWEAGNFIEQGAGTGLFGTTTIAQQFPERLEKGFQDGFDRATQWVGNAIITTVSPILYTLNYAARLTRQSDTITMAGTPNYAAELTSPNDAQLFKEMTIPADERTYLSFDLGVENAVAGDFLTVSFGNDVLFYQDVGLLGQQDIKTVLPIYVGDHAGETGTLLFALSGGDISGGSILVDNVTFSTLVPEPATLSLFALAALCLVGYVRRRKRAA